MLETDQAPPKKQQPNPRQNKAMDQPKPKQAAARPAAAQTPEPKPPAKPAAKPAAKPTAKAAAKPAAPQEVSAEVNQRITSKIAEWRPAAWEDDISRNTLDSKPFENLLPISRRVDDLKGPQRWVPKEILETVDVKELALKDTAPIPCPADREGYSPGYDGNYWLSGLGDYFKVLQIAQKYDVDINSYFDFGCASGRVIRHFAAQANIKEIWGSDINARHIRWLCDYMPTNVRAIANHCVPTLPVPDNSIDLISAFSVFTHIDTFETCWLAELRRILAPGGIAYLTVHNEATWVALRGEVDNEKNRLIQSLFQTDPSVREKLKHPLTDTRTVYRYTNFGPYRAQVFTSDNYLRRVWGRFFDVLEILDCHHVRQSVVVLRKPS